MAAVRDGGLDCYDCEKASGNYMVHDIVWEVAFPEYRLVKSALKEKYPDKTDEHRAKRYVCLCLDCLERRLGRPLEEADFDLKLPINHPLKLGIRIGRTST